MPGDGSGNTNVVEIVGNQNYISNALASVGASFCRLDFPLP